MSRSRNIIVAIDETDPHLFKKIVDSLDSDLCIIKIGSVSFNAIGQDALLYVAKKGFEIFLDLKFHDIPTTVYKACISAFSLDIWMVNVHLSGGYPMVSAAAKAKVDVSSKTKLIGVTVLTSLSDEECASVYGSTQKIPDRRLIKDIAKHIRPRNTKNIWAHGPSDLGYGHMGL